MLQTAPRPLLAALLALTLAGPSRVPVRAGLPEENGPVTLALKGPEGPIYVGQTFAVVAELGFEPGFRDGRLVPLFRQELELPVQLALPYLEGLDCAQLAPEPLAPPPSDGPRLVVGETVTPIRALPSSPGSDAPERFELRRDFIATCPGPLLLRGASLRYAAAAGFRDDLFAGRVPLDPSEHTVVAADLSIEVSALPEAGRPPDFSGALGPLTVRATVAPRDLRLGDSLQLTVEVQGEVRGPGGLARLTAPRPEGPGWEDLAVLGTRQTGGAAEQRIVYDLRPEHARVGAVPPLQLSYFEPGRGYRVAQTEPVTILVRPAADLSPGEPGPGEPGSGQPTSGQPGSGQPRSGQPRSGQTGSGEPPGGPSPRLWLAGGLGLIALAAGWWVRSRRTSDPAPGRPEPLAALEAALDRGADPDETLVEYLAARLGVSQNAVRSGRLAARLVAAGQPEDLARRLEALLGELEAARFGTPAAAGQPGQEAAAQVRRLARELDPA